MIRIWQMRIPKAERNHIAHPRPRGRLRTHCTTFLLNGTLDSQTKIKMEIFFNLKSHAGYHQERSEPLERCEEMG